MPAPTAVVDLLDVLQNSRLLKESMFDKVCEQIPGLSDTPLSPERLARSLVKSQLVTLYQAQRLLAGETDGFYLGKYKLLDVLGRGGMGKVYLAEQISMQRLVALKVINRVAKNRHDTLARFAREAKAVAALSHPNIIQAYDYDEIDGLPFISMEFVEGIDVGEQLVQFGPLTGAQAADYGLQAALGLEQARKSGFVHRDIKPGNLLVDRDGVVKILDLGLAVSKDDRNNDSLTGCFDQVGTVDYMAPEQALDSHGVDIRADIYALGGVLYFLLSGQLACLGKNAAEKLLKHQQTPPMFLGELAPDVPGPLIAIIHKMLEKRPAARFQTPAEVAEALRPFAQRTTPPYDLSAIKNTRESLAPLLGRSPELGSFNLRGQLTEITLRLRGDDISSASKVNGAASSGGSSRTHASSAKTATMIAVKVAAGTMTNMKPMSDCTPLETIAAAAAAIASDNEGIPVARTNSLIQKLPSSITAKAASRITSDANPDFATETTKSTSAQPTTPPIPESKSFQKDDCLEKLLKSPAYRPPRTHSQKKRKKKRGVMGIDSQTKMLIGGGVVASMMLVGLLKWLSQP